MVRDIVCLLVWDSFLSRTTGAAPIPYGAREKGTRGLATAVREKKAPMDDRDEPRDDAEEEEEPRDTEPWAKTSSGDADSVTQDD
jgi:hypothetical protein